jgi:hypothetical protein
LLAALLEFGKGGCTVSVVVDPVVVIADEVAVSVEHGVSVLFDVNSVTQTLYVPAAILPPVDTCEIPV